MIVYSEKPLVMCVLAACIIIIMRICCVGYPTRLNDRGTQDLNSIPGNWRTLGLSP